MTGIASDHAGFLLKYSIIQKAKFLSLKDYGCFDKNSVDYPDYMLELCMGIINKDVEYGIAICGTGIGASIACNRFHGIRAALCQTEQDAAMARRHNNANILVLAGNNFDYEQKEKMIRIFFDTKFEGGRHQRRIDKLDKIYAKK